MATSFVCIVVTMLSLKGLFRVGITSAELEKCKSHSDCDLTSICCKTSTDIEKRCRRNLQDYGNYCASDADCEDSYEHTLCCRSNVCELCLMCKNSSNCGSNEYCCIKRAWKQQSECRKSCYGATGCKFNSDCGDGCCSVGKCVPCWPKNCTLHCQVGQHCCNEATRYGFQHKCCNNNFCSSNDDCQGHHSHGKCCIHNRCVQCPGCNSNRHCTRGKYCCRSNRYENASCEVSCVGFSCTYDQDCGPPDERCLSNRCVKCGHLCHSNSNGAYCCNSNGDECMSSCIGYLCRKASHCRDPGSFCSEGKCSYEKRCNTSSDCITSDGKQYYCCLDTSSLKSCHKDCNGYQCSSDTDCASNKCCDTDSKCKTCTTNFSVWLIGAIVGGVSLIIFIFVIFFCCWFQRRMQQTPTHEHSESNNNIYVPHELRERNVNYLRYTAAPGQHERNLLLEAQAQNRSTSEQEQHVYTSLPTTLYDNLNNVVEMVQLPPLNLEQNANRITYSEGHHAIQSENEDGNDATIPPPPYSTSGQVVSTEHYESPPSYQV